jgi:hypothetical protein
MLKICRESIERLCETSPLVPEDIIKRFQHKFHEKYPNVATPDIANGLKKIIINSPPKDEIRYILDENKKNSVEKPHVRASRMEVKVEEHVATLVNQISDRAE